MPLFIATYEYVPASAAQQEMRPKHREFLSNLGSALVASGPTDTNGAVLIFEAASAAEVAGWLDADPFRSGGFIAERRVFGWTPVLGHLVTSGVIG